MWVSDEEFQARKAGGPLGVGGGGGEVEGEVDGDEVGSWEASELEAAGEEQFEYYCEVGGTRLYYTHRETYYGHTCTFGGKRAGRIFT